MLRKIMVIVAVLTLSGCAKTDNNEWQDIDYGRIARENYQRENDNTYVPPPTVESCTDDDLYNCRTHGRYVPF